MQAAIEARAVTHRTRAGKVTVRDISLTVDRGELVAIIGGSGSGKTTLLDALSGLRPPTSGTVLRDESRQAGYVPRQDSNPPVLPLARALRYTAALRGVRRPGPAVADALALIGLTSEASLPVNALNPGSRKRAAIAAELLAGPTELFLDEPTAALDPAQATEVLRLLRRLSSTGITVLFTTSSPLDAARCDKVAVLATGGHLAFYGTPAAARGYFGADSLEEIYERLSGLGDPAAAWSRRFFYFSRTTSGSVPVPTTPRAPGPALLVPDLAGPHSAGRPSFPFADDLDAGDWAAPVPGNGSPAHPAYGSVPGPVPVQARSPRAGDRAGSNEATGEDASAVATGADEPEGGPRARPAGPLPPLRQLPVLIRREAEILTRARGRLAILAGAPAAVLLAFLLLLTAGALDGPAAVTLAWAVLGGLAVGLACELPARHPERGVLRCERFAGLSPAAFVAAKATVLLPVLATADALILAVPAVADRLQDGFGLSYLAVFIASLIGLAAASATLFVPRRLSPCPPGEDHALPAEWPDSEPAAAGARI